MSDKLGPIEIEFLLDKKADAEAKNLKNSLDAVGAAGKKAIQQVKDAIKEQLKVIKEVEKELKELQRAYDKITPGIAKRDAGEDLGRLKRTLSEEYSILTGLQEEHIALNKKEEESASSLTGMISKWAIGLGGAAAGLKILKDAFKETSAGLNLFNNIAAVTKQVLYDIVSGAGLSMSRLSSAAAIQKEFNALREEGYIASYRAAVKNNEYQQAYSDSLDATLSRAEKIKKIDEALEAHAESIKIQQEEIKKSLELTQKAFLNQPGSDKLKKQISDLKTELEYLNAELAGADKRLTRQRSILMQEEIDEMKQWREDLHKGLTELIDDYNKESADKLKELNNAIALNMLKGQEKELLQLKQKYEEDMEAWKYNQEIRTALAEKYAQDQYEIAMKYLDKLKKENEKLAADILKLDPGRGYSILKRGIKSSGGKPVKISDINKIQSYGGLSKEEIEKIVTENLEKQLELRQQILEAASELAYQLADTLGLEDEAARQLNGLFMFLSGDYIGALTNLLSGFIASFPTAAKEYASEIARLNDLLEEQTKIIEQSERKGGKKSAMEDYIESLKKQKEVLEAGIKKTEKSQFWFGIGKKANKEFEEQLEKLLELIGIAEQEYKDFLTGGITENTIADAVAQGFIDGGKKGIDNIAEYMNDVLKNAANEIFKGQILDNPLMKVYLNYIKEALSDNVLTPEEKEKIDQMGKEFAEIMGPVWDALFGSLDFGEESADALTGAIKGITEETAGIIEGQIRAIRISQAEAGNIMKQQLVHIAQIAANTRYNKHLESIDRKLDALNSGKLRAKGII